MGGSARLRPASREADRVCSRSPCGNRANIAGIEEYAVTGVTTNLTFFRDLLRDAAFVAGHLHTGFLDEFMARRPRTLPDPHLDYLAAAVAAVHTIDTAPGRVESDPARNSRWAREGRRFMLR